MKSRYFFVIALLSLLFSFNLNAQFAAPYPIKVTVQVVPPYSPYISTYVQKPNKLILVLQNVLNAPCDIKLKVKLEGDNGILVSSNSNFKPSQSIHFNGLEVKQIDFSNATTRNYFDESNVDLVGITKAQLYQNQALPEGNYKICVQALDYNTNALLSDDEPVGCSGSFSIYYIDPPVCSQPICGSDVNPTQPQNIIFNWMPPATASGVVKYDFVLKEVPNNLNPNDVVKNPAFPVLYNSEITSINTLIYTPAMPKLDEGKKYVWRVRVSDPNNASQFKNNGYSEACSFYYRSTIQTFSPTIQTSTLSIGNVGGFLPVNTGNTGIVNVPNFISPSFVNGKLKYVYSSSSTTYPLKKANIVLKTYYLVKKNNQLLAPNNAVPPSYGVPDGTELAITKTNDQGDFNFMFTSDVKFGLIQSNYLNGSPEFADKGELYRCAKIEILDPHAEFYWNPQSVITPSAGTTNAIGTITTKVKDCKVEVTIGHQGEYFDEVSNTSQYLAMANVYLCRKYVISTTPNYKFPESDGMPDNNFKTPAAISNMKIVAKGETDASGKITFKNVVYNINPNYTYYVYADFPKDADGFMNYYMEAPVLMNNKPESGVLITPGLNETYKQKIFMYANWPKIAGLVVDETDNKPISCFVKLESLYLGKNGYNMFPNSGFTSGEYDLKQKMVNNQCNSTGDCIYKANRYFLPGQDGKYNFENLPTMIQTGNIKITGPLQILTVSKQGYDNEVVVFPNFLKMGEQSFKVISLKRGAIAKGTVVDAETKKPVHASFYLLGENGGGTTTSHIQASQNAGITVVSETFSYPVLKKSAKQKLIFEANGYLRDTVEFVANQKEVDLGEIKLSTIKRRLLVIVKDNDNKALNDATVEIVGVSEPCNKKDPVTGVVTSAQCDLSKLTVFGMAVFQFKNAGGIENNDQVYNISITPPQGSNLLPKTITAKIPNSSDYKKVTVKLEEGTCVSGYVFGGKGESLPISGARVSLDISYSNYYNQTIVKTGKIEAITDSKGYYTLRGVPLRSYKQYIRAYKSQTQFVGDSIGIVTKPAQQVNVNTQNTAPVNSVNYQTAVQNNYVSPSNVQAATNVLGDKCMHVNFNLTLYDGMDITKLMGFPVELYGLTPLANNAVQISGAFIDMPGNNQFKIQSGAKLTFANLNIIPGALKNDKGMPYSEPASLPISTGNNELNIIAGNALEAKVEDKKIGVYLDKTSAGKQFGIIKGKVKIPQTNFNQTTIAFNGAFYLMNPADNSLNIPVFNADASVTEPIAQAEGFKVCNETGNDLNMSVPGFADKLTLDRNTSRYKNGEMKLNAILHTDIKDITPNDLKISINNILLKKNEEPKINSSNEVTINLQNWKLKCNEWEINSNGFNLKKSFINTENSNSGSGGMVIPVSNLKVTYDHLVTNNTVVDFNNIKLAGIQSINVTSSKKNFGLVDGGGGANTWQLGVSSDGSEEVAAEIAGLPAVNSGDVIKLKSILLRSNGDNYMVMKNHPVTLKNCLKFTPNDASPMVVQTEQFAFPGMITMNVPDPHAYSATSFYKKSGSALTFSLINVEPIVFSQGSLYHTFTEQPVLENKLFVMKGNSKEDGVFPKTGTTFNYSPDSVSIWITPGQDIPVNAERKFAKACGNTHIEGGKWSTFWFEGELAGMQGISNTQVGGKPQRMKMIVDGAVTCSGKSIAVENVSTPFGDMSWAYDFAQSELKGSCNINFVQGGLGIVGGVTSVVGAGGWYFQAEGKVTIPGVGDANLMGLFGNYNKAPTGLSAGLGDFKCLPPDFNNKVKGFIFSAGVTRQIVPGIDWDFGIVGVKFGVDLSLNARVYKSFGNGSDIYGIGLLAVGKAYATGSCGVSCTEVSAEAAAMVGISGEYNATAKTFDVNGCASVGFSIKGEQCVGAFGICCGDCCLSVDIGSLDLGTNIHFNSDSGVNMSLIFDKCSNQCK